VVLVRDRTFLKHTRRAQPITTHCSSWPIRAHCAFQKEGLHRDRK